MTPQREPEWREHYLKVERSAEQKRRDLVIAFDEIHNLQRTIERFRIMLWIAGFIITGLGGTVALLANFVLERVK